MLTQIASLEHSLLEDEHELQEKEAMKKFLRGLENIPVCYTRKKTSKFHVLKNYAS